MKQTAVKWLYNNLKSHFEHDGDLLEVVQFSFNQAKAMEKEQAERMYSEAFEWLANRDYLSDKVEVIKKEFKQFKKK